MKRFAIVLAALGLLAFHAPAVRAQGKLAPGSSSNHAPAPSPAGQSATPSGQQATTAPASGERALTITVPEPGTKYVRILPSADSKQPEQLPQSFTDVKTTISYDPKVAGKAPKVAVDDAKTGNTAIMPIPAADKPLDLHRADFDRVHVVKVTVAFDNHPVQVARVTLEAADKSTQTRTIDASAEGQAIFNDVPAGKAKLTLVYGNNLTETKDIVVTTDHPHLSQAIAAVVSNKVPTLDTPLPGDTAAGTAPATQPGAGSVPAPGTPPSAPAPQPPQGGGIGGFVGEVLALGLVAGGIFLFWKWFQTGGFAATMKKVGVEVGGPTPPSDAGTPWAPNAPAAPVVSDPSVCQFCGQKKDAAGNCACSLTPGSGPAPVAGAVGMPPVASQPRLIGTMGVYSGSIFPLNINGTGVTLGRETSNTIPLNNDTTVSRRHAAIRNESGAYVVSDEGSANGVFVNGVRISGAQPLRPGDEVQIGNTRFRFEM